FGRDAPHRPDEIGAEPFAQLDLAEIRRKAERHVLALAAEEVDQHPAAFERPRHLLEDEAGCAIAVRRRARNHANVLLPGEAAHRLALSELGRLFQPLTQIVVAKPRLEIRTSRSIGGFGSADRGAHGVSWCGHSRSPGGGELTRGVAGAHPANRGPPFRMQEAGVAAIAAAGLRHKRTPGGKARERLYTENEEDGTV